MHKAAYMAWHGMTYFQTHALHATHAYIYLELAGYKYKALSQATR